MKHIDLSDDVKSDNIKRIRLSHLNPSTLVKE